MGTVAEVEIQPNQVWVSRGGQRWLILPNEDYRADAFRGINSRGETLMFWISGKVAYRYQTNPEDLIGLSENQTLEITITPKVQR